MGFDGSNPSSQALAFSATGLLATDNGTGNDALVVSGGSAASRIDYTTTFGNASSLGGLVAAAATAGAFAPAHVLGQGANNASLVDVDLATNARGQPVASAATTAIWAIDGQVGSPLAYVGNAGSAGAIVSYSISSGGLGAGSFPTLTLPASVDDLLLAADGTLYAAAGGSVYALQTDSPGLGTAAGGANASAWPTPARDACRSSNLSYSCPY